MFFSLNTTRDDEPKVTLFFFFKTNQAHLTNWFIVKLVNKMLYNSEKNHKAHQQIAHFAQPTVKN